MICALLLSAPLTLAESSDEEDDTYDFFEPFDEFTQPLEDACVSMLQVTLVSFGGHIEESDQAVLDLETLLQTELHRTVTTVEEVWKFPGQIPDSVGLGNPLEDQLGPAYRELIEVTRTTIDAINVTTPIHVEWQTDTIVWERVERSTVIPLPADLDGIDMADVIEVCDEDSLRAEEPWYDSEYDYHCPFWWPEQFAPEVPENETYIRITDLTVGLEPEEGIEPVSLEDGFAVAPGDVEHAVLQALREYTPEPIQEVVNDATSDEADDAADDDGETSEGSAQDDAEAAPVFDSAPPRYANSATASVGGVGLAGLLGTVLALRRR